MPTKTRIIIVSVLIMLGGAFFSYCVFFYPVEATAQAKGGLTTVISTNKETPTGGIERDKSGQIKKTRSKGRSGPKAGAI